IASLMTQQVIILAFHPAVTQPPFSKNFEVRAGPQRRISCVPPAKPLPWVLKVNPYTSKINYQ
ncbi:hypothetical protein, partial [Levilactobacillus spicheri]|uniref:hypothetical protein n=1 Tax=Levilactobacillus spicheri TaxID=216463 RepID=UPI001CDB4E67